jgi:hypothetical protein
MPTRVTVRPRQPIKPVRSLCGTGVGDGRVASRSRVVDTDIARYMGEVEPLVRRGATVELDGQRPVGDLADIVEQFSKQRPW